ncbi:hypothetical protein A2U01_0087389, partial [Trifolium medium]|nr:hypothetical protein [Trifolium medium]
TSSSSLEFVSISASDVASVFVLSEFVGAEISRGSENLVDYEASSSDT